MTIDPCRQYIVLSDRVDAVLADHTWNRFMDSPADLLHALAKTTAAIRTIVDRDRIPSARAAAIAGALHGLWPAAPLTACALCQGDLVQVAATDAAGRRRPDWEAPLLGPMSDREATSRPPPPALQLAAPLQTQHIAWRGRGLGMLAVVAAPNGPGVDAALLELLAEATAAHLTLDAQQADLAAEAPRADVGELAGPLIHDVTNLLNNLMLNLTVLEQGAGDVTTINVPKLRARSDQLATLIREVQDYRRRRPPPGPPVDVNAAVREAAEQMNHDYADSIGGEFALDLELGSNLRPVAGARTDLARCLLFLFKSAARAARRAGRKVHVRTSQVAESLVLRVHIPSLVVPVESPLRLYDNLGAICPGMSGLELASCKSMARRFNGKFAAECPADTGLSIVLEVVG